MEEQILAFLAGTITGLIGLFMILLVLGSTDSDPDNW